MVRSEKNKELFDHWFDIVNCVFTAEHNISDTIIPKVKNKEITPQEYIESVVDEILSKYNGSGDWKEEKPIG